MLLNRKRGDKQRESNKYILTVESVDAEDQKNDIVEAAERILTQFSNQLQSKPAVYNFPYKIRAQFDYESIGYCTDELKIGFRVTKFHYSKKSNRPCIIKLSENMEQLIWQQRNKLGDSFGKKSLFPLSEVTGFVYGAHTFTFQQYKGDILKSVKLRNQELLEEQRAEQEEFDMRKLES